MLLLSLYKTSEKYLPTRSSYSTFQDYNKRSPILYITNDEEYFIVNLLVGTIISQAGRKRVTEAIVTNFMTGDATT